MQSDQKVPSLLNIMLKDDKTYPYILLTVGENYPRLIFTRARAPKNGKYFGPYVNAYYARKTIEAINRYYPMKLCGKAVEYGKKTGRVCLNYHIGLCGGVCQGTAAPEDYTKNVQAAESILFGNYKPLIERLTRDMLQNAEQLNFEAAAALRELRDCVSGLFEKQKINAANADERDIIGAACEGELACVQVFCVRDGKTVSAKTMELARHGQESGADITSSFVKQYYTSGAYIPREIVCREDFEDRDEIAGMLSETGGGKIAIKIPQKGDKRKLAELAYRNAVLHISAKLGKERYAKERMKNALVEIGRLTASAAQVRRIEIYDVSHISGTDSVGVMTVFEDGRRNPAQSRKFRIKYAPGKDDYASVSEIVFRRLERARAEMEAAAQTPKFLPLPEVILIDGGAAHVKIARQLVLNFGYDIAVAGLVKNSDHKLRALVGADGGEYALAAAGGAAKLLNEMSEAVHKDAVGYHRKSRAKHMVQTELTGIAGIGENARWR
jgi:excinuclease ABC subunit C